MRHLLNYSVYQNMDYFGDDVSRTLSGMDCDGLEMLTSYEMPDDAHRTYAESVHLPYATDWLAGWQGRPYDMPDDIVRYMMYGRSREEIIDNLSTALDCAASMSPAYGVMHAGNADISEVYRRRYTRDSKEVLDCFCDMMNTLMAGLPGGEPPFRILFENLWWPGLRLVDESDFRILDRKIEFENWGICLDTGHMMNCLSDIRSEGDGINSLLDIFYGYGRDLIDKIVTVHFHYSASYDYRTSFEERGFDGSFEDFMASAYPHVGRIDQHMPFSDRRCSELLEILQPQYVTHEMPGSKMSPIDDFRQQRSLLD